MRNFSFLRFIRHQFGTFIFVQFRKLMRIFKCIVNARVRIRFLKDCLRFNLIPKHIHLNIIKHLILFNPRSQKKLSRVTDIYNKKLIKIELNDSHYRLHCLINDLHKTTKNIERNVPMNIFCQFLNSQYKKMDNLLMNGLNKVRKKIVVLTTNRSNSSIDNIPPITLPVSAENKITANTHTEELLKICPSENIIRNDIGDLQKNWIVNLSNKDIPKDVQCLLQLGGSFNLPVMNKKKMTVDFIKGLESNIERVKIKSDAIAIRNKITPILTNFNKKICRREKTDKILIEWFKTTKKFINDNEDLIFTRADKGNTTVILNRSEYKQKMMTLLNDTNTYQLVKNDPSHRITESLRSLLGRWKSKRHIDDITYKILLVTDGLIPRAYGLPKIHKKDTPLRIIVSSINSTLNSIAIYLQKILNKSMTHDNSNIKNSLELKKELMKINLTTNLKLASFDVVSLFTNIPINLVNDSITLRWGNISRNTTLTLDEFLNGINLVLQSTFFKFDDKFYKQIFGTPMGSPLSPIVANMVLQDLERKALDGLNFSVPLYFRYVDDILIGAPQDKIQLIFEHFNSMHDRLKFTLELSNDNSINFLNLNISIMNNQFAFDLYYKPTFSGRYLNFLSNHPLNQKRSIIFGLTDKIMLLTDQKHQKRNFEIIINNLQTNNYPTSFIFNSINRRIKYLKEKNFDKIKNINDNKNSYCVIPFTKGVSNKFSHILAKYDIKTAFFGNNKLDQIIKTGKDQLNVTQQRNVVYRISCTQCNMTYVGQTKRQLKTRIKEHKLDINKKTGILSVISEHRLELGHEFDWANTEILDIEKAYNKRLISEMIYIKMQNNSINRQTDTVSFPESYLSIF